MSFSKDKREKLRDNELTFGEVLGKELKNNNGNGGDNFGTHNSYILCK